MIGIRSATQPPCHGAPIRFYLLLAILTTLSSGCKTDEEVLQGEHDKGKFIADKKAELIKGIGESLKGRGAEGAESLSEGIGAVFKGAVKGFDASLEAVKHKVDPSAAAKGINVKRASRYKVQGDDDDSAHKEKVITAYMIFEQDFSGKLQTRAMKDAETEIGRATVEIKETSGEAKYIDFAFDERTPITTVDHFLFVAL